MSAAKYFAYIRVSTARQGQTGTSLSEQRAAIERHANRHGLEIVKYYEERETAAKAGRPVFLEMLRALRRGKATGVVMHKIDRSARNLKDWADLGELIDCGVEVHFANESIDLTSRGGRLSADIQAVVAADYIRNLREETKKGIYGRLKQGLFPFRSVIGYSDAGRGKPKEINPVQSRFVREAFNLYATGEWGLDALIERMHKLGLRSRTGGKITRNGLSTILKNPFYIGVIRLHKTGELFPGAHEPIISKDLFDRVQAVLDGKNVKKQKCHFFTFRRHIICSECGNKLIAELQKGWVYYRCQTKKCPQKTLREELIERELLRVLGKLRFDAEENRYLRQEIEKTDGERLALAKSRYKALQLQLQSIEERLSKLADAFVDGVFDKETYINKKNELVLQESELREQLSFSSDNYELIRERLEKFLELVNDACLSYKKADAEDKRDLMQTVTSNFTAKGKSVSVKLNLPFQMVYDRARVTSGSPYRATSRTLSSLIQKLYSYFQEEVTAKNASTEDQSLSLKS